MALEDSANGLRFAHAAGLRCINSPSAYTQHDDFADALTVIPELSGIGGLDALRRLNI